VKSYEWNVAEGGNEDWPRVDYVVRDEQGRVVEIVLKSGERVYAAPYDEDPDA